MARIDPRNTARYWNDPQVAGLSYLHADFTTHTYAPHAHDGFVIAVTETGGSEFHSRGQTAEATQATLLVFNPDEPHSGRMGRSTRWRYRSLYLETPAAAALMGSLGLAGSVGFTRNVLHDPDLIAGFLDLHAARDAGRDALEQRERLVESFGALFSKYADGGNRIPVSLSEHGTVGKVIALMRERYAETLTLEQMSAPVGLTPFQLIGLFKRSVGLTAARAVDPTAVEGGDARAADRRDVGGCGGRGRILRPERAQQAFQAVLRNHPAPIYPRLWLMG